MEIRTEDTKIKTPDGEMPAHVARPSATGPLPGVIVIMEAFGLNRHIKDVTERIAREGYLAVAPDLYHRSADRVAEYSDLPKALKLMGDLQDTKIVDDVRATHAWLTTQGGVSGDRVGMTGFCMGGRVTFLAACHLPIKAAVPFYGGGIGRTMMPSERTPHPPIDDAAGISGAMLVFYGDKDAFIPMEEVNLVKDRLSKLGKSAEVVVYKGADHGFFCDERPSYNKVAAEDAWKRMLALFEKHLKR
jgi:carboxymethylenebutenolidase